MPKTEQNYPMLEFPNRAAWRRWLEENHAAVPGIYLVLYKKGSGVPSVTYEEAVLEALCFGWIDSRTNSIDAQRYRQVFTPRKSKSPWSKTNKARVEKLIEQGLMTSAGMEKIEAAQREGSWTALDASEELQVPADLQAGLDDNPTAARNFAAFSPSVKKMFIRRVDDAKRPETRRKRVEEMVGYAEQNKSPFVWTTAKPKQE